MSQARSFFTGLGYGIGLMYFLDPHQGRRRRKQFADQIRSALSQFRHAADVTWRDMGNRSYGTWAELRSAVSPHDNSDQVVADRVRSKIGRYVSHPRAIHVEAHDGQITLTGQILVHEVERLVMAVKSITGVKSVHNHLEPHQTAEHISALQGGRPVTGERWDLFQDHWSPTTRLLVGALCGVGFLACARSKTPAGMALGTLGTMWLGSGWLHSDAPSTVGNRMPSRARVPHSSAEAKKADEGMKQSG